MAKEKQPQTVTKTEKDPNINVFGLKRKPIQNNYNGVAETRRYLGRASLYSRGGSTKDL